jgi:hypothetical protein
MVNHGVLILNRLFLNLRSRWILGVILYIFICEKSLIVLFFIKGIVILLGLKTIIKSRIVVGNILEVLLSISILSLTFSFVYLTGISQRVFFIIIHVRLSCEFSYVIFILEGVLIFHSESFLKLSNLCLKFLIRFISAFNHLLFAFNCLFTR